MVLGVTASGEKLKPMFILLKGNAGGRIEKIIAQKFQKMPSVRFKKRGI